MKHLFFISPFFVFSLVACSSSKPLVANMVNDLKVTKKFSVQLPSNPSTGYSWQLKQSCSLADSVSMSYQQEENKSMMIGAGGVETWTFKAIGVGSDSLVFIYRRPFEPASIPPVQSQTFYLNIQ